MAAGAHFHSAAYRRERLDAGSSLPRHRHRDGYITVVLGGGYHEAGLDGRWDLEPGSVVVHRPYDAHVDHIGASGAELINLPLPVDLCLPVAFTIADPDAIAHLAETDLQAAAAALAPQATVAAASDWPDRLAADLARQTGLRLGDWADAAGLAAETLSRGFRLAFGLTPARFRAEIRARQAIIMVEHSDLGLAAIAADCGYADQPHLNRALVELTGLPPGTWRRSNPFKRRGGPPI